MKSNLMLTTLPSVSVVPYPLNIVKIRASISVKMAALRHARLYRVGLLWCW